MKIRFNSKVLLVAVSVLALTALGAPQIKQVIKLLGVGVAVKQFGPQMNTALNKLVKHTDTPAMTTKVVPILSIGLGKSSAVGAAQVTGPRAKIATVEAVAQPEVDLFGKEIRIRALIPVSSKDVVKNIKKVEGVGVTGIIDLKL